MSGLGTARAPDRSGGGRIEFAGVGKIYTSASGEVEALAPVDLDVDAGSFVSLVGPSGCGKSTLLKLTAGLLDATSGAVLLDGDPMVAPRRDVGVMFQTPVLFPWRTVLENVLLPGEVFKKKRSEYVERARNVLELVGLSGFEKAYPKELSGGMQQRVALSRLLAYDPEVLVMDEPFGALDEFTRERLNLELLEIWESRRKTVFFVTHSISEAVFLSDRVGVMGTNPGRVLDVVEVGLPRPRTTEMMRWAAFTDHVFEIRKQLAEA